MPLPGYDAQKKMSPSHRAFAPGPGKGEPFAGAVLLLLYPGEPDREDLYLVLTVRTEYVAVHKGQVSLPGGGFEEEDLSLAHTALREASEELGVRTGDIRVIGELTPVYIEPSNFHVYPYVAYIPYRPTFIVHAIEVCEVLEVPVAHFRDENNVVIEDWLIEGAMRQVPYFDVYGKKVWGATAIILGEFTAVLERMEKMIEGGD